MDCQISQETSKNEKGELEMSCLSFLPIIPITPHFLQFLRGSIGRCTCGSVRLINNRRHRFSSQCLSVVHDQAFGARTPNYKVIQELDKKVRGFYIPPSLRVPGFSGQALVETERPSLQLTMQRYVTWSIKEISGYLNLSSSSFAQRNI
jgi:hypothetical protein